MRDPNSEQTAFFGILPTAHVPRLLELLANDEVFSETIETYTLPAQQLEAEYVAGRRMLGRRVNSMALAYEVIPHESRPTSLIKNVASGEEVEAITKENFQAVARELFDGKSNTGSGLANAVCRPGWIQWTESFESYMQKYVITYEPKRTEYRALRVDEAPSLLAGYEQGEIDLRLSRKQHKLLAHVCELIEVDSGEAA